eukprot:CAMPEP_0184719222 /NCGR_PEP_ID=MMETSP0314-20130426/8199_1 /TAXON_ID=38298 /ORGANISM="Rhodella maculata, Strain CCMP 736" /LENGTH=164 /DNA_ID=CAMNT_0027183079 /DNA_START=51 /DNA_END=542 /DNA_ORIENTATION=-
MPPLESPPEPPPKPPPTLPAISTLIPYALSLAAWLGLAAWTVSLDSQSYAALQLLLTCTIFAAVVFHLRRRPAQNLPDGAGVGAENEERKLSAYSVFNPGCQRLLGEIDPAAFDDHYRNLPPGHSARVAAATAVTPAPARGPAPSRAAAPPPEQEDALDAALEK